jgi:hypothetical protein
MDGRLAGDYRRIVEPTMSAKPTGTEMLAACEGCGALYGTSVYLADGVQIELQEGGTIGPCPVCGVTSRIPPGLYEAAGEARGLIMNWPAELREQLAVEIAAARKAPEPREALTEALNSNPAFRSLARLLIPRDAAAFWALVAVIVMLLKMTGADSGNVIETQTSINQPPYVQQIQTRARQPKPKKPRPANRTKPKAKKRGR